MNQQITGRSIVLLANHSANATFTRGAAASKVTDGMRLLAGDAISSGSGGSVFFQVDADKLFELLSGGSVNITQTGDALAMTLTSGEVRACTMGTGAANAGTTTMNVRG